MLLLRRFGLLFLFVAGRVPAAVRRVQAGLVERVVLGGRAEEAGAAAGAAGAVESSGSGGAGSAEAAVQPCRLQGLVDRSITEHYAYRRDGQLGWWTHLYCHTHEHKGIEGTIQTGTSTRDFLV